MLTVGTKGAEQTDLKGNGQSSISMLSAPAVQRTRYPQSRRLFLNNIPLWVMFLVQFNKERAASFV